jgi:hypothetical protein
MVGGLKVLKHRLMKLYEFLKFLKSVLFLLVFEFAIVY